jgi:hypothetical protein
MKILKGWRKISHDRGFVNETTGQTVVIRKKEFSDEYLVFLFAGASGTNKEGEEISPEFPTESKAEAFAVDWMKKHTEGLK